MPPTRPLPRSPTGLPLVSIARCYQLLLPCPSLFCYRHLCRTMPVHAVGVFFALLSASRIPATNLLGPSSNVEVAKASHSPRLPAMETMGMRDPEARIKLVRRSLSPAGTEWHRRTRSKSPD